MTQKSKQGLHNQFFIQFGFSKKQNIIFSQKIKDTTRETKDKSRVLADKRKIEF